MSKGKNLCRIFQSKSVSEAYLLKRRPLTAIIYAYPSIVPYLVWLALKFLFFEPVEEGELDYAVLLIMLIVGAHALSYLSCMWSPNISRKIQYYETDRPEEATTLLVIPKKHHGSALFCNIIKGGGDEDGGKSREKTKISVNYQNRRYIYDYDKKMFTKVMYPDKESFDQKYIGGYEGITGPTDTLYWKYGMNICNVPIRSFIDLFIEHTLSPLFVFQVFSVMLWILDGMINYSLYVLTALVVFESFIVAQRLKTMREFQSMTTKPYEVYVCRDKKWIPTSSSKLLPSDLVSISPNHIDKALIADMLLINGSCLVDEAIMTGESTPQVREGVMASVYTDLISPKECTFSLIHSGTTVLQVSPSSSDMSENEPPDGGIKALVVRTGFSTKQGKLIKKIIYNNEKISLENTESLLFIALLLFFAIIASAYVWIQGNKDETRKKGSILLDCVLIIVSAVPPELPTEISLSVNNSLNALTKNFIFCMEPFRIPYAGKIDVACFDKTGTLTQSDLVMDGVVLSDDMEICPQSSIPALHKKVLATAQNVVLIDNKRIGDPMEKNTMDYISWDPITGNIVCPKDGLDGKTAASCGQLILKRFQFSSALKRMSALSVSCSDLESINKSTAKNLKIPILVSCKGAPEILQEMLLDKPEDYDSMYKHWVKKGRRVLTFAYKIVHVEVDSPKALDKSISLIKRSDAETGLKFAGMLIFSCPLKSDAKVSIKKIIDSSHKAVIITGDNVFTACHVAKELDIVTNDLIIADVWDGDGRPYWKTIDEEKRFPINPQDETIAKELQSYDMCISGRALKLLHDNPWMGAYCPRLCVYARISPSQKENIIIALKNKGYCTMMCGDGTNDMGALKCSHVGIAILNGDLKHLERTRMRDTAIRQIRALEIQEKARNDIGLGGLNLRAKAKLDKLREDAGIKPGVSLIKTEANLRKKSSTPSAGISADTIMGEIFENIDDDAPLIRPGDASVAAPFTSKASCIDNIVKILCQGRATLVAILQTYKILALNCIVSAFTISSLTLSGFRQSDIQTTIAGIAATSCFYGISKSKSLDVLSKQRPQAKAFGSYVLTSIVGQAIIHIAAFTHIRMNALKYSEEDGEYEALPDDEFYPNLVNTSIYLISLVTQISTFIVNYQGHPFRQSLRSNKPLWNATIFSSIFVLVCMFQVSEGLNKHLQLVHFSDEFRNTIVSTSALDILGSWLVEKLALRLFSDARVKSELFH